MTLKTKFFYLSTIALAIIIITGCNNCEVCKSEKVEFDTLYINEPSKCSYVILRKKTEEESQKASSLWNSSGLNFLSPVDTTEARKYIMAYNKDHNADLRNTAFVDFNLNEILRYLIEVTNWASVNRQNLEKIRAYFAKYPTGENTLVLVATTKEKGDFIEDRNFLPVNYGSLCPPPTECFTNSKAELLIRAINASEGTIKP